MTIQQMQDRLGELHESSVAIVQQSDDDSRSLNDEELALVASNTKEFDDLKVDIERRESIEAQATHLSTSKGRKTEPTGHRITADAGTLDLADATEAGTHVHVQQASMRDTARWGWRSIGEYAMAVKQASAPGGNVDTRLEQRAPTTFGQEGVGADGGFAVPPDFRNTINQLINGEESIAGMCDNITTSSNNATFPIDDTTAWQTTGGILAFWDGEGDQLTQSKPNLKQNTVRLNRLTCLVPVTEELMEDAVALTSWLTQKAPQKINFKLNLAILQGTGVGQPQGILDAACTVSVAKESNQAADTVVPDNIIKMFSRCYAPSRSNAVWLINQDVEPQLNSMSWDWHPNVAQVGTATIPVFLPAGNLSGTPHGSLMGRPIIPTQACETVGDTGDIFLADLKQYMLLQRGGGIRADTSIHLYFDYAMTAFRFILRVGGQPWWNNTLSARDGNTTYGPFVKLDVRS